MTKLKLGEKVMLMFDDGDDNVLVVVDNGNPKTASMADVLVLVWSAIRKNYHIIQAKKPTASRAGIVYLYSPEFAERAVGVQTRDEYERRVAESGD